MKVPFNKPYLSREEISCAARVIRSRMLGGNGPVGRELEKRMGGLFKVRYSLLTTSCTHALEMALMALGVGKGDEVILPSFNFVSMANAIVRVNAKPVFVDIEDEFLNIDPARIRAAITKRTKAVICVHYAGIGCRMDEIMRLARKYGFYVIEDAAQAVGSKYDGRYLGTIGDIGCFSFHGTKNLTCGEGGAFLTNSKRVAARGEIIREKGTNRSAFLRREVNKYSWIDVGSSYVMSEILAAVLFAQLNKMEYVISKRRAVGMRYIEGLSILEKEGKIIVPRYPLQGFNWHLFYFRVRSGGERDGLLKKLRARGVEATSHFLPLHLSPYARKNFRYKNGDFPVTEEASRTLVRLPIYPELSRMQQQYVVNTLCKILK